LTTRAPRRQREADALAGRGRAMTTLDRDEMLLSDDDVSIFHDGMLTDPQLDHPEGVAVDRDGNVWCGGERGQIYRLDPDGTTL
jgi:sugar lactone lactonase YvrE